MDLDKFVNLVSFCCSDLRKLVRKDEVVRKAGEPWVINGLETERCPFCSEDLRDMDLKLEECSTCDGWATFGTILLILIV